jgi:hypothetical protein
VPTEDQDELEGRQTLTNEKAANPTALMLLLVKVLEQIILLLLFETGSHYVAQAGLEPVGSSHPQYLELWVWYVPPHWLELIIK